LPAITIEYADVPKFQWKVMPWKKWLQSVAASEGYEIVNLEYVFCSDDYLLEINRKSLQHDDYTDIITFDMRDEFLEEEPDEIIDGVIYISVDRVAENAGKYQVTFFQELARVMVHGMLHLCGYGDKSPEEQRIMRGKEDDYLLVFDWLKV
jgi:rRNA maturation RNase YbeY